MIATVSAHADSRPLRSASVYSGEGAEGRPHLVHERGRLFERSEMTALVRLAPVPQVTELPLGPAPGWADDLLGEDRTADRYLDRIQERLAETFPVQPRR